MADPTSRAAPARPKRAPPPLWLVEGLEIVRLRTVPFWATVAAVVLVGAGMAFFFPALVPPLPLVGVAVAVAAILLGMAVAISVDAGDRLIRGPRHVTAAGAELVAILPFDGDEEDVDDLARAVLEAREEEERKLLIGLASARHDVTMTVAWTDRLGMAIARHGASVLRVDLASGRTERPGLFEVQEGRLRLNEVVEYEPELRLARTGAGGDQTGTLMTLPALHDRLPRDLDVLLVALPLAASRPVVVAARSLDHVLVVAERDRTSRVDLIAGIDALEAGGAQPQVVLLDTPTARALRPKRAVVAVAEAEASTALPEPGDVPVAEAEAPTALPEPGDVPVADEPTDAVEDAAAHEAAPAEDALASRPPQVAPPAAPLPAQDEPLAARDVELVLDAAAASAAAEAERAGPDRAETGPEAPDPARAVPRPVEVETAPAEPDEPDDGDPTDELPKARPQLGVREEPEEDDLRTVAYLTALMDDLEARERNR